MTTQDVTSPVKVKGPDEFGSGVSVYRDHGHLALTAAGAMLSPAEWEAFKAAGDRLLAGTCEATGTPSGTVCGVTPAAVYAGACEHGHPREGRLCAKHASPPAALWCRECFELDGEAAHVCDVTPALVPEVVIRAVTPGRVHVKHGPGCRCTPCLAEPGYRARGQVTP